jgi:hypothetical protein
MTVSIDRSWDMLLQRLSWPSGLVRERACAALSDLILDPDQRDATEAALREWLRQQQLESPAAVGLLPFVRAKLAGHSFGVDEVEIIRNSVNKPSILSWLLTRELASGSEPPIDEALVSSESASSDYQPPQFFTDYVRNFVPPIYDMWATKIEQRTGIPFRRQWAYEWDLLSFRLAVPRSTSSLNYWLSENSYKLPHCAPDPWMSEVYRSAFLRALAWVTVRGELTRDAAILLAADTCPIDLDLWMVRPSRRPEWWPQGNERTGKIDTVTPAIWRQVEEMWSRQRDGRDELIGSEWILASASGIVQSDNEVFDLEIGGMFQRAHGPNAPYADSIAEWYFNDAPRDPNVVRIVRHRPLHFEGSVREESMDEWIQTFEDWTVLPAAGMVDSFGAPARWQYWRLLRPPWLPHTWLLEESREVGFEDDSALIVGTSGTVVGRWSDWTDGLQETRSRDLPPLSGQFLAMNREVVEEFANQTQSTFCWVCRVTVYHREHSYDSYQRFDDRRIFGPTAIIRP